MSFDQSTSTSCDRYEVWSSEFDQDNYNLVGIINKDEISATMSISDTTYINKTTLYYNIYTVKSGKYSIALNGNITSINEVSDATNLLVTEGNSDFVLTWDNPIDRRFKETEIKVDKQTTSGALTEGASVLVYTGNGSSYKYTILEVDKDKFFQFWVYSKTNTI